MSRESQYLLIVLGFIFYKKHEIKLCGKTVNKLPNFISSINDFSSINPGPINTYKRLKFWRKHWIDIYFVFLWLMICQKQHLSQQKLGLTGRNFYVHLALFLYGATSRILCYQHKAETPRAYSVMRQICQSVGVAASIS